jgi:hypothetical protein
VQLTIGWRYLNDSAPLSDSNRRDQPHPEQLIVPSGNTGSKPMPIMS